MSTLDESPKEEEKKPEEVVVTKEAQPASKKLDLKKLAFLLNDEDE